MDEVGHDKPHPGLGCQVPGGIAPGCKKRTSRERAGFGKKDRLLSENSALIDTVTIR
jgi:hypothetical protein